MRISERQRYDMVNLRVDRSRSDNNKMLEVLSTQKRINNISDDPLGAAQAMRLRNQAKNYSQFQRNVDFAKGFLERSESAISTITDNLIRAKELGVAMANDTYGPKSLEATGREVLELKRAIISQANSVFGNRYVFGGFRTSTPPLSIDGRFLGDDGAIFLQVDPENFRQVNLQARNLFETSPQEAAQRHMNMVDTVDLLFEGMMKDDEDMMFRAMEELDYQLEKTTSYQATIGARHKALEDIGMRLASQEEISLESASKIDEADIYRATSDFKRTETVLQSTLLASNKLLQPSLLNFLQ